MECSVRGSVGWSGGDDWAKRFAVRCSAVSMSWSHCKDGGCAGVAGKHVRKLNKDIL